jgi:DNA-binding NarL/FixJ family response regulator
MARVRAFIFDGRLKVRVSTLFSWLIKISVIAASYRQTRAYKKSTMETRREAAVCMARDITISSRELTPFERLVLELVCEGRSNGAIALQTSHSEKVVENTVSRSAQVFGIKSDAETNLRVLLALAYRAHYGDKAFDDLDVPCSHLELGPDGKALCNRHVD